MRDRSLGGIDAAAKQSTPILTDPPEPQDAAAVAADQAVDGRAEAGQAEAGQAEAGQAEAGQAEAGPAEAGQVDQDGQPEGRPAGRWLRRGLAALAWLLGAAVLFALFLRIALFKGVDSDGANNALQAWDLLHGHILLHGWIIGDATYYTFELPLIAIVELFFGLHPITMDVAEALVYLIVSAWAIAIAVRGSRGAARAVRALLVVTVLAAPTILVTDMWIPLGIPDHTGTTVFLLVCALLVDRATGRWFTPTLICVILTAGQIGDVTVRYVAVPAIIVVCAYRVLASRKILSGDTANVLGAAISLPLAVEVRTLMLHYGAYLMVAPKTKLAPFSAWGNNLALTWGSIRQLFGAQPGPNAGPTGTNVIFGYACLFIAVLGIARVIWRWRTARRGEQILLVAIAGNLAVYIVSTLPAPNSPHDIVAVLPCGAVLGALALVPERISSRVAAAAATALSLVGAVLPLSIAAARPPQPANITELTAWLEAHGLKYGLGGYWDGSAVTLQGGGQVNVRAIHMVNQTYPAYWGHMVSGTGNPELAFYAWETNSLWYDPTRYDANFVVINVVDEDLVGLNALKLFGKPASTHFIGAWEIFIYHKNLLTDVSPAPLPATS